MLVRACSHKVIGHTSVGEQRQNCSLWPLSDRVEGAGSCVSAVTVQDGVCATDAVPCTEERAARGCCPVLQPGVRARIRQACHGA